MAAVVSSPRGSAVGWCLATALALVAAASPAFAQRPQFRSTVELVQMQVGVASEDGNFVPGLSADDFELEINGRPRPVQVVYEVDLRAPEERGTGVVDAGTAPETAPPPRPAAARRHWLLFFDFSFTTRRGVLQAREAALQFLDHDVRPDDLVGVATANRFGIKLLSPFTSNHDQAREAVQTLGLVNASDIITGGIDADESIEQALSEMSSSRAGTDGGVGASLDAAEYREYVATVANYEEQMQQFGRMLQAIEGRKHVVYFSRGFDDRALVGQTLGQLAAGAEARARDPRAYANDADQMYGAPEVRDGLNQLIEMFRAADAVVHAIDPSGLRDSGVHDASRQRSAVANNVPGTGADLTTRGAVTGHQALVALAAGTGGTADWAMNDLSVALEKIDRDNAAYYMIGYRKAPDDPPTVKVSVRVKVPGVKVVNAPRVLTPPPEYRQMNEMQRQLQLAEYLADDVDRRAFEYQVQVVPLPAQGEKGHSEVLLQVPAQELERIAAVRGDDQVKLEIGAFVLDAHEHVVDSFRRGVGVNLQGMKARGPLSGQSFRFTAAVHTPPGPYRLRMLLRDVDAGFLSSRTQPFWSPGPVESMWLARPLVLAGAGTPVSETAQEFDPLVVAGRRVVPEAAPELSAGQEFPLLLVAYHVPRHPVTGAVLAGVVLEVQDMSGQVWPLKQFEILGTSRDEHTDALQLLIRARIPDAVGPGDVRLWARLVDQVAGTRVEEQARVFIRP